jgi:asparagine synthase (glutamine-hydrolysing)
LLSQYSIAEMTGYTQHMLLKDTDQMSMASGLEVRVPFFDNDLVDYVLRIPDALKYPHTPKQLLVDALEHRLPADIVQRPKMGFTLPWDTWLRGELRPFCEARIDALSDRGIINGQALQQMWRQFKEHRNGVLWSHVWMFVVFEHWLERNLD